jgi:hypothetical protein
MLESRSLGASLSSHGVAGLISGGFMPTTAVIPWFDRQEPVDDN